MIQCPICHKTKTNLQENRLNLYRCNNCSHTFTIIPKEKQEHYGDDYFLKTHKNWFENPNYPLFEFIYSELSKLVSNKKIKILDVGCGKGDFLKYIATKNSTYKLFGIDLIDNQHPSIYFIKGDFLEEKFETKFDVIFSFMVVEHIDKPHLFIQKINNSLQPGGFVFISTINNDSFMHRIARMLNKVGIHTAHDRLYSHHHIQHYTNKSLRTLMVMNGFDILWEKKHNYPIKAVDVPESNFLIEKMNKFLVWLIFLASEPFGYGMLQTILCRRKGQ